MEFIIVPAMAVLLLLIIGVDANGILLLIMFFFELLLIAMTVFFAIFIIILFCGKPRRVSFVRFEKQGSAQYAIYELDGQEYRNTFPAELMLKKAIYRHDRKCLARIINGKNGSQMLFDWYSHIIIIAGLILSATSATALGIYIYSLIY